MFALREETTFAWPVIVKAPVGLQQLTVKFEATFKVIPPELVANYLSEGDVIGSLRVVREALVSFKGVPVLDDADEEIDDLEIRKEIILSKPYFVDGLMIAYSNGVTGKKPKTS